MKDTITDILTFKTLYIRNLKLQHRVRNLFQKLTKIYQRPNISVGIILMYMDEKYNYFNFRFSQIPQVCDKT
jgi:hypothetical protein